MEKYLSMVSLDDVETQVLDWGTFQWLNDPRVTGTEHMVLGLGIIKPGFGHTRHNHGCDEFIYFLEGTAKQTIERPDGLQEKIIHSLMQYREGFLQIGGNALLTLELMLLSVLCRIALCSIPYFVLLSLGCRTGYLDTLALTVYIYAAVTLIPTPGNSGVSEGAFYLVFSGIGSSGVFWAMLLWRLVCYYSLLLLGLLLFGILTRRYIRKPAPDSGTQAHDAEHSDPAEQQ